MMSSWKSDEFRGRMETVVGNAHLSLGLGIGHTLGLFKAMMELGGPATAGDIASRAGCKPWYVKQWLHWMTAGGVVVASHDGTLFELPADHMAGLQCFMVAHASLMPSLLHSHDKLMDAFTLDGPQGLDENDIFKFINTWEKNRPTDMDTLLPEKITQIAGLDEKLVSGIDVLDIGCSRGHQVHWLASRYPQSRFTGVDISPDIIREAQVTANVQGLTNVTFLTGDAQSLPADWTERFDLVVMMSTYHHFPNIKKATLEMHRVLKPEGWLSVVETEVSSDPQQDVGNVLSPMHHAYNMYYCYSTAANYAGNEALGSCEGAEKLTTSLQNGGFEAKTKFKVAKLGAFYMHISCTK